ncbi:hypothetical protein Hanom_Chr12g01166331 [Helianthus anomalus]
MFMPNFRRCSLLLKLMSFVLNISKSYTLCPLGQTQLEFSIKLCHVHCTRGYNSHFPSPTCVSPF